MFLLAWQKFITNLQCCFKDHHKQFSALVSVYTLQMFKPQETTNRKKPVN